ncbi:TRAP transporter small permease [Marivita sp. GX14005]|uniref:TRAP transporter small permease n=1 Tax=Marivita sp. GX14005 TaxID=2942276 RepID=UPI002019F5D2|nr:TRAP transporter small permease [Marivita sp. GX14005]MCL3883118.1 TRAP transporter small permease [Marivita sp. GX14005]
MNATGQDSGPPTGGRAFERARAGLERVDGVTRYAVIAAMGVMAVLVVTQVVFRYAFSSAIDWSEEVARLAFVWAMFLAIPHGIRRGIHVGIDALVVKFPLRLQEGLFRATALLGALLMAVIFWFAWDVTAYTWPDKMPTLNLTAAVYYIAVLVAAVHALAHLVLLAWGGSRTWDKDMTA